MTNLKKPSAKPKQATITGIREQLKKVVFNPKKPGPMKIIADMDDANYFEMRAIELIQEARAIRIAEADGYDQTIIKAMQLMVLILCQR